MPQLVEYNVSNIHDFVEQAPLSNIEQYIRELQDTVKSLRNTSSATDSPVGGFKRSEFLGQYDR